MVRRILCLPMSALAVLLISSECAWAHPGHGVTPPEEPAHWIVEPIHAWPILLAVGLTLFVWRRHRSRA